VDAQFEPPIERLAFHLNAPGEADLPEVWVEPLPLIVQTLRKFRTATALSEALPDVPLWGTQTRSSRAAGASGDGRGQRR
jgi:hypothetical protein